MSRPVVSYIHGRGGSADEAEHYRALFPGHEVVGLDYRGRTAEEAIPEITGAVRALAAAGKGVTLIANSIGAWYSLCAGIDNMLQKAYFISPIVDMERLICDMMVWAGVTEDELKEKGVIHTRRSIFRPVGTERHCVSRQRVRAVCHTRAATSPRALTGVSSPFFPFSMPAISTCPSRTKSPGFTFAVPA